MGILSSIFGSANPIGATVNAAGAVANLVDKFVTTDEERAAADMLKMKLLQEPHLAQIEVNKIEASHRSIFVAGWRPFIGWVCGVGLAYAFIAAPFLEWITLNFFPSVSALPIIPTEALLTLVVSLLGLGGMRTVEKMNGTSR